MKLKFAKSALKSIEIYISKLHVLEKWSNNFGDSEYKSPK